MVYESNEMEDNEQCRKKIFYELKTHDYTVPISAARQLHLVASMHQVEERDGLDDSGSGGFRGIRR